MIITDESWYIVRNTKGVTGFVGPGSKEAGTVKWWRSKKGYGHRNRRS